MSTSSTDFASLITDFLTDYFGVTDYINVESFFAMMATERSLSEAMV